MPHKHVRKGEIDKSTVDLPPTEIAKPLPTSKSAAANGVFTTDLNAARKGNKRKRKDVDDDTPKAFMRLMAFQQGKRLPKGLDDGIQTTKAERKERRLAAEKRAAAATANGDGASEGHENSADKKKKEVAEESKVQMPKIQPGERMSEFSARVDAALPVGGLINKTAKNVKDPLGLKVKRTKKEKKMHKMYDAWREEEKKIQEKKMDSLEDAEEEMDEDENGQVRWKADLLTEGANNKSGKKAKKGKRKRMLGEVEDGEGDDPWGKLKRDRGEVKHGLNDVVLAPPTFSKLPTEKFKVRGGKGEVNDVPKASGSLRRREELGEVRRGVVEGYRQMMKDNRAAAKAEA